METPPFDGPRAHRWFGVEFNNLAWELWEKPGRTKEEDERMIHMAHASCLHWQFVGKPENHQRGQVLVTCAYTAAGIAAMAALQARRCLELTEQHKASLTDFDLASGYGCAAAALRLAGDRDQSAALEQQAREVATRLSHPDDVRVAAKIAGR